MRIISIDGIDFALRLDPFDAEDLAHSEALGAEYAKRIEASGFPASMSADTMEAVFCALTDYIDGFLGKGALALVSNGRRNVRDAFERAHKPLREAWMHAVFEGGAVIADAIALPEKYRIEAIRE